MLERAWDDPAARWNQRIRSFVAGNVVPDSEWWIHDEADQLLAAMDLHDGFAHQGDQAQLARSAQTFLDVFVDRDPFYPARETFARISRNPDDTDLRKSFFGKNMLHNNEHALIMYLHGRALEGRPAKLYYAFPAEQALTAVAKPYWFDAAGGDTDSHPRPDDAPRAQGRRGRVRRDRRGAPEPLPLHPTTRRSEHSPHRNPQRERGWLEQRADDPVPHGHRRPDRGQGDPRPGRRPVGLLRHSRRRPGARSMVLPDEGVYDVGYFAVDRLGNQEPTSSSASASTGRRRRSRACPSSRA